MMNHICKLGKILVFAFAFLAGRAVLAEVPAGAGERAWQLLAQGNHEAAIAAADASAAGSEKLTGTWIGTLARSRAGRPPLQAGPMSEAAHAFAGDDYATCADALEAALAEAAGRSAGGSAGPADRLQVDLQLGACWIELGRIAEADSILGAAIAQARAQGRSVSEAYGLINRGRARVRMRQTDPPREDLLAALALCEELELPAWAGRTAIALSVISRLQMDLDDSLRWREKALVFYRTADDLEGQATATHYIGTIDLMRGDLTRAMVRFQEALELARRAGDPDAEGGALGEMASVNYLLGDFEQALNQYREAVRMAPNPWRRGMMLINIGSILEYQQHYAEAREVLEEAVALMARVGDHRTEAEALRSLGETLCETKEFGPGLEMLDRAVALSREYNVPMTEAYALKCKGHGLLDSGDLAGAAASLAEAAAVARRIDYFDIIEWSLLGQAMVARRQGDLEAARAFLEESLAEVAEVRRRSGGSSAVTSGIVGEAASLYDETIDVLYRLHRKRPGRGLDKRAFAVAQEAKARSFLDQLTEAEFDLNFSAVPNYRKRESEILTRIVGLEKELGAGRQRRAPADSMLSLRARLAAAEDELQLLEAELRAADPRYAEVLYQDPLSIERLASEVLRPDETLLEYALGDSASYVWAVNSRGVTMAALPPRSTIESAVRDLLPLLRDYNLSGGEVAWLEPPARELYGMLIAPVAEAVSATPRLVISPDGILHYLPFEVLIGDDTAGPGGEPPWLVRDKIIAMTPSASVLERVRARPAVGAQAPALLVGDPVLEKAGEAALFAHAAGAEDLASLAFAQRELAGIAAVVPDGTTLLTGKNATAARLAAGGASGPLSLVHFATHGLFNEDRPRWSGLVLSPDPAAGDDGFLSMSEVLGLTLTCDQVVLSACSSALGHHVSGEGLVGLTRGFLFAGARSVVSALWDVSGEAAAVFMITYYQRLTEAPGDRAAALAYTKREMIRVGAGRGPGGADLGHPAFWAAFVISGDGR